jgi:23S rRNA (adenine1618-N6)-methyltransferase
MKQQDSKTRLHPRSKHRSRYDFPALIATCPELSRFVTPNKYGDDSIDFADATAVKTLNRALLLHHYKLTYWDIPQGYLCPPIPGRADYIHHAADILLDSNKGKDMTGPDIKCLDIGVGANCIYPIIGLAEYGWTFVGTDIDPVAIENCNNIIMSNPSMVEKVSVRLQSNPKDIFKGIMQEGDYFHLTICNPPFHASLKDAKEANLRKVSKISGEEVKKPKLNFAGHENELWCEGGEMQFITTMILQSKTFASQLNWISTMVSKASHVNRIHSLLRDANAKKIVVKNMGTGNKVSRVVAWRF